VKWSRRQVTLLGPAVLVAIALFAFVLGHDRVDLAHGTVSGGSDDPGIVRCYTSGTVGDLVTDPAAGVAIVEKTGARYMVMWPSGYMGQRAGSEVEVLNREGRVIARTGTHVSIDGGYSQGGWVTCGAQVEVVPAK
jgi:hypothetical protein